jgi:hypothetical protein
MNRICMSTFYSVALPLASREQCGSCSRQYEGAIDGTHMEYSVLRPAVRTAFLLYPTEILCGRQRKRELIGGNAIRLPGLDALAVRTNQLGTCLRARDVYHGVSRMYVFL